MSTDTANCPVRTIALEGLSDIEQAVGIRLVVVESLDAWADTHYPTDDPLGDASRALIAVAEERGMSILALATAIKEPRPIWMSDSVPRRSIVWEHPCTDWWCVRDPFGRRVSLLRRDTQHVCYFQAPMGSDGQGGIVGLPDAPLVAC